MKEFACMKEFAFISDFDGTLTDRDFYHILIDKYLKEEGTKLYIEWKKEKMKDVDFLNTIFGSINRSEEDILEDILKIPFDRYAKDFIEGVKLSGGDFIILSAGTSYYIEKLLKHYAISGVTVISNKGIYKNRGINMIPDAASAYYSERYGVDKLLVVEHYKQLYKKVFYAGDSGPDLNASMKCDTVFAKGELQDMLKALNHPFMGVDNFDQIGKILMETGVIEYENSLA